MAQGEYWGLRAIADRMGWRYKRTPITQAIRTAFPIFKRRHGRFLVWYSNAGLIRMWELNRIQLDRAALIARASTHKLPARLATTPAGDFVRVDDALGKVSPSSNPAPRTRGREGNHNHEDTL